MVKKLFEQPHVVYQTPDDGDCLEESAITACLDASGLLVLGQGKNEIVINRGTVKKLTALMKKLASI